MKLFKSCKILPLIFTLFITIGCSSSESSAPIELSNFKEQENVDFEVGNYFKLSPYLYAVDTKDHTYMGSVEKVISPDNETVNVYDYQFKCKEIGLYRVYLKYDLTSKDTRAKTLYINSKDNTSPEVFFRSTAQGYVGVEYTLPNAISNDESGLPVNLSYKLYFVNEEGSGLEEIALEGKKFIPQKEGLYRYKVFAADCYDNVSSAAIDFTAVKKTPLLHNEMNKDNYTTVAKVSRTGGGYVSDAHYDEGKGCFSFQAHSQDNLFINIDKNVPINSYDLIRIKTICSSDVTNAFIQAEIHGTGTGNVSAYFDRKNSGGYSYFEMSVEKFLPYWDFVSFNLATMIILTKTNTPFEFYEIDLVKNADIVYQSPLTANVKETYTINTSCDGAVGATFNYVVKDPLGNNVALNGNTFVPDKIGKYTITSTIVHFFYEGSIETFVDIVSSKKIVVSSFEVPNLGDIFTVPSATLDGTSTGITYTIVRDGETISASDNKFEVAKNGRYTIIYSKVLDGVTYSNRTHFDVGVTHLETFSNKTSLSKAYGSPSNIVTTSFKEEYAGEDGVVAFDYTSRWPNIFVACPNLDNYDFSEYEGVTFDLFLPDSMLQLNGRYGRNNEDQDLTYYVENKGIKTNQWSSYTYSTALFFNKGRQETKLPLMLIGIEKEKADGNYQGTIYLSDVYLTKKNIMPVKYGIDFEDGAIPEELTITGASSSSVISSDNETKALAIASNSSSTKVKFDTQLINDMFTVNDADAIYFDIKLSDNPGTTNCFYFESTVAQYNVVNYNNNTGGISSSWATYYFPKTALAELKDGVIIRVDNQSGKTIYIDNIRPGKASTIATGCNFDKAFISGKSVYESIFNPSTHSWENKEYFSVAAETGMEVSLSMESIPGTVMQGTRALRVTTDADGRFMSYISSDLYNALPDEGLKFDIYSIKGSTIFNMLEDWQVASRWYVFDYTRSGKWVTVTIPKSSIKSSRLLMFRTQDPGGYIDFYIDNIRPAK